MTSPTPDNPAGSDLRAPAARLHLRAADVLENVSDAFVALDREWRILYANHEACRINQKPLGESAGRVYWEEWPAVVGTEIERQLRRVMEERTAAHFEYHSQAGPHDVWLENDVYPSEDGINIFYRDISARKRAGETLRESEVRFRALADNIAQLAWMAGGDGSIFWYNKRWFEYTGAAREDMQGWGWQKAHHPDHVDAVVAKFSEHVREGRAWGDTFPLRGADGSYRWFLSRAAPIRDAAGRVVLWCGTNTDVTEQRAAEEKLSDAYEREALLNRIGHALRDSLDPELIQETAAALVGEALGAERCYFSVYDPERDVIRIGRDWRREGLPSVAGEYRLSEYQGYVDALYRGGTAVIADAQAPAVPEDVRRVLSGFRIRAFLAVPLFDGGRFAAALAASMSGGPREWTAGEVALMEAALTQTRTAVEGARLRLREHRIAEQLQAALQPPLPEGVAGLQVAKYYEAALAEAGVGGDFYDCFPLEKGCTALAVGDLSGKGLAAAAQVSTVRNMLRAFLYSKPTLAEAATDLNWVVALNGLLTGFATLWVGRYDGASGALSYVNMGQEPALLRRAATGEIEQLPPTGPVLGADENAVYGEERVFLSPGDVLAVFTDGATECGPSRLEMLGVEGVAFLLGAPPVPGEEGGESAGGVVRRLAAGVVAASRGGVARDDTCILVAVAEGGPRVTRPDWV